MNRDSFEQLAELTKNLKKKEKTSFIDFMGICLAALFLFTFVGLPILIYLTWANTVVIQHLWAWFVVTTFDLKPLTMSQAWGLSIIVAFMTHVTFTWKGEDERDTKAKTTELVTLILKPWLVLLTGWVCAHYFMHVI